MCLCVSAYLLAGPLGENWISYFICFRYNIMRIGNNYASQPWAIGYHFVYRLHGRREILYIVENHIIISSFLFCRFKFQTANENGQKKWEMPQPVQQTLSSRWITSSDRKIYYWNVVWKSTAHAAISCCFGGLCSFLDIHFGMRMCDECNVKLRWKANGFIVFIAQRMPYEV